MINEGRANAVYSSTFWLMNAHANDYGFEGYTNLIANDATKSGSLNLMRGDHKGTF